MKELFNQSKKFKFFLSFLKAKLYNNKKKKLLRIKN